MKTHHLKTWPSFFQDVRDGTKRFEVRKNDRDFATGDHLVLHEFKPDSSRMLGGDYTGRTATAQVRFVEPEIGVSPGQACVAYDADNESRVLGGGFIRRAA